MSAAEASDSPYLQRDGGLITPMAPTDVLPTIHNRLTASDYGIQYAYQAEKVGGGIQTVELNVLSKRTQSFTWSEYTGQGGGSPSIRNNYVNKSNEMTATLAYLNRDLFSRTPAVIQALSVWMPRCRVSKYDYVGASAKPVGFTGTIKPLIDQSNSGRPFKIVAYNGVSSSY